MVSLGLPGALCKVHNKMGTSKPFYFIKWDVAGSESGTEEENWLTSQHTASSRRNPF